MINVRLILTFSILILISCKSRTNISKTPPYPIISLEKTTCLGTCPAYKFLVYPNGVVKYSGYKFVDRIGDYQAKINDEEIGKLKEAFENAHFFDFANVYSANMTDLPTTYLYYDNGNQNSKVTDYFGAPKELKSLESFVEAFIETIDWKKTDQL